MILEQYWPFIDDVVNSEWPGEVMSVSFPKAEDGTPQEPVISWTNTPKTDAEINAAAAVFVAAGGQDSHRKTEEKTITKSDLIRNGLQQRKDRALALMLLRWTNDLANKLIEILDAADNAVDFAAFKAAVALINNPDTRNRAQLMARWRNLIDHNGSDAG